MTRFPEPREEPAKLKFHRFDTYHAVVGDGVAFISPKGEVVAAFSTIPEAQQWLEGYVSELEAGPVS